MKKALVLGCGGQDGSYLCEFLLSKGYEVHGMLRRSSNPNSRHIDHLLNGRIFIHYGDMSDSMSLLNVLIHIQPDEIYHLAAQSHVGLSFQMPEFTGDVTGLGTIRLLEAIRKSSIQCKFYHASSSEMFGKVLETPQKETTPFYPRSPYACAKVYAHNCTVNYREAYGMFACNGILFNHESPRRGENFVTRKITLALAKIIRGKQDKLHLGNLQARRDWGYAPEYVEAMWLMLQQDKPDDYVIATGETHSVEEFCKEAFEYKGLDWKWYVDHDTSCDRPSEVDLLIGDASKAKKVLGWSPKTDFKALVRLMVDSDLKLIEEGLK